MFILITVTILLITALILLVLRFVRQYSVTTGWLQRAVASWMDQRLRVADTNALCLAIPSLAASFALFPISYICRGWDRMGVCNQRYDLMSCHHHHGRCSQ